MVSRLARSNSSAEWADSAPRRTGRQTGRAQTDGGTPEPIDPLAVKWPGWTVVKRHRRAEVLGHYQATGRLQRWQLTRCRSHRGAARPRVRATRRPRLLLRRFAWTTSWGPSYGPTARTSTPSCCTATSSPPRASPTDSCTAVGNPRPIGLLTLSMETRERRSNPRQRVETLRRALVDRVSEHGN